MGAVLHSVESPRSEQVGIGYPFTFHTVDQMMIPCENIDLQSVISAEKFAQKISDLIGKAI